MNKTVRIIKFEDYKQRITDAIQSKLDLGFIEGENDFALIENFIMQPIYKEVLGDEVSGNFVIGGPIIPLVAIVGNTSGRIYYFALKALLPDLRI